MPNRRGGDRKSAKAKNQGAQNGRLDLKGETREHIAVKAGFDTRSEMGRVAPLIESIAAGRRGRPTEIRFQFGTDFPARPLHTFVV
jgi:hypothetical protein